MHRVRWHGQTFSAELVDDTRADGMLLMRSLEHGARFTAGTEILVHPDEVVEVRPSPLGLPPPATAATIQAQMDQERERLPSVQELLAQARQAQQDKVTKE